MTEDVYCACGAQWHGKYVRGNEIIALHAQRGGTCRLVPHQTYLRLRKRRCFCRACVATVRKRRKIKRDWQSRAKSGPAGP